MSETISGTMSTNMPTPMTVKKAAQPLEAAGFYSEKKPLETNQNILSKPIKVLMYYPDYGAVGGIERYIETLCYQFKKRFESVTPVVICSKNSTLENRLKNLGIKVYGIQHSQLFKQPHSRFLDKKTQAQLIHIVKKENPDLIHLHIGGMETDWLKKFDIPAVLTWHGYGTLYQTTHVQNTLKKKLKTAILKQHFKSLKNNVNFITFIDEEEKNKALQEGLSFNRQSQQVIANGIDTQAIENFNNEALKKAFKRSYSIPENAFIVSFAGRLDNNKQPLLFLSVVKQMLKEQEGKENIRPIYALVAGNGELFSTLKRKINQLPKNQQAQIKLLGNLNHIYPFLATSDVIIHPARQEGFGLGVLEAMALGTPVIASNTGGLKTLLKNFPDLLINAEDEQGFYQALLKMTKTDLQKRDTLTEALKAEAKKYDAAITANTMMEVYRHVIQN